MEKQMFIIYSPTIGTIGTIGTLGTLGTLDTLDTPNYNIKNY